MNAIILGDGGFGRAIAAALVGRGEPEPTRARPAGVAAATTRRISPAGRRPAPRSSSTRRAAPPSHGNVDAALAAGHRRFVIGTTAWDDARSAVERALREHGAAAVAASNLSLGVALFGRLVDRAVELFGPVEAFDPYIVEWHRRTKADRPSGTAKELSRRILAAHPRKTRLADPHARRLARAGRARRRGHPRRRQPGLASRRLRRRGRVGRAADRRPRPLRLCARCAGRRRLAGGRAPQPRPARVRRGRRRRPRTPGAVRPSAEPAGASSPCPADPSNRPNPPTSPKENTP